MQSVLTSLVLFQDIERYNKIHSSLQNRRYTVPMRKHWSIFISYISSADVVDF